MSQTVWLFIGAGEFISKNVRVVTDIIYRRSKAMTIGGFPLL